MANKATRWTVWIVSLFIILAAVSILSLCTGPASIGIKKIFSLFLNRSISTEQSIIFNIRLPRIILGLAIGGALSIAGVMLQGMFRNPLVEPYTLGISGGAALGVCINMLFKINVMAGPISMPLAGFLGAIAIMILIYALSNRRGMMRIQGLLLTA